MAEKFLDDDVAKALSNFFNGKVKVYEAESEQDRPEYFEERPFLGLLPEGKTIFLESLENNKDGGAYEVSVDTPAKGGKFDTEASRLLQDMEARFNKVKPDMSLFVIDTDIIRARYAMDESENRSLGKSLIEYIKEKSVKLGVEENFPAANEDRNKIIQSAFTSTNAYSSTRFGKVSEENLKGEYSASLIVAQNPDQLQKGWMVSVPGVPERMELKDISYDDMRRFTIYHEFGHALDPNSNRGMVPYLIEPNPEAVMVRYKKECFADAHAVLQIARDKGNTNMGELLSDIRIYNIENRLLEIKSKNGREATKPELEKRLEKMQKDLPIPQDQDKNGELIRLLQNKNEDYGIITEIGSHAAYYTTTVVDAAVEFAQKGLKDGSLLKMSDADVLKTCEKIVEDNALSMNRMNALRMAIFNGDETNQDVIAIRKRAEISDSKMPISKDLIDKKRKETIESIKKSRDKKLKKSLGIPQEKTDGKGGLDIALMKEIITWRDVLMDKIVEAGDTKQAILDVVAKEKDELRKYHGRTPDKVREAKLDYMNKTMLSHPDVYVAKVRTRKTVIDTISSARNLSVPKRFKENVDINAADYFLKLRKASLDYAGNSVKAAESRDLSISTPNDYLKAVTAEALNYNKAMIAEKAAQEIAFAIRKDTKVFAAVAEKSPGLGNLIDKAAVKRHPDWIEDYHLAFGSTNKKQIKTVSKKISTNAAMLDLTSERFKEALSPKKDVLNALVANAAKGKTI